MPLTSEDMHMMKDLLEDVLERRMEPRFDALDARFDGVDARLDGIDARLDGIDVRLDSLETEVGAVQEILKNHTFDIARLKHRSG